MTIFNYNTDSNKTFIYTLNYLATHILYYLIWLLYYSTIIL